MWQQAVTQYVVSDIQGLVDMYESIIVVCDFERWLMQVLYAVLSEVPMLCLVGRIA